MEAKVKRTPIIMQAESVLGILADRKTQTRRLVKPQPDYGAKLSAPFTQDEAYRNGYLLERWPEQPRMMNNFGRCERIRCPYGKPGDQLIVKETYAYGNFEGKPESRLLYAADGPAPDIDEDDLWEIKWKSPRFMPWGLSRLTLELTEVRVERLQDISAVDAIDEGVFMLDDNWVHRHFQEYAKQYHRWQQYAPELAPPLGPGPIARYQALWDEINGDGSWAANPWVWALTFKKSEQANG